MDPMVRTLLLVCGVIFVLGFGAMTAAVAADSGVDVFTGAAIAILLLIGAPLIGALFRSDD